MTYASCTIALLPPICNGAHRRRAGLLRRPRPRRATATRRTAEGFGRTQAGFAVQKHIATPDPAPALAAPAGDRRRQRPGGRRRVRPRARLRHPHRRRARRGSTPRSSASACRPATSARAGCCPAWSARPGPRS